MQHAHAKAENNWKTHCGASIGANVNINVNAKVNANGANKSVPKKRHRPFTFAYRILHTVSKEFQFKSI